MRADTLGWFNPGSLGDVLLAELKEVSYDFGTGMGTSADSLAPL
ncbi:hypothetical protein SAMN04515620_10545 [Collimonas sp. OK607]|nr:hypothetical protein SAMN04515620_10545 [Collimonas sp. OK607]